MWKAQQSSSNKIETVKSPKKNQCATLVSKYSSFDLYT